MQATTPTSHPDRTSRQKWEWADRASYRESSCASALREPVFLPHPENSGCWGQSPHRSVPGQPFLHTCLRYVTRLTACHMLPTCVRHAATPFMQSEVCASCLGLPLPPCHSKYTHPTSIPETQLVDCPPEETRILLSWYQ